MEHENCRIGIGELATYLGAPVKTLYARRHRSQGPPAFRIGRQSPVGITEDLPQVFVGRLTS